MKRSHHLITRLKRTKLPLIINNNTKQYTSETGIMLKYVTYVIFSIFLAYLH